MSQLEDKIRRQRRLAAKRKYDRFERANRDRRFIHKAMALKGIQPPTSSFGAEGVLE